MPLGIVVIGRNEGERLRRCLESVSGLARRVVYVDSASTDGSVSMAQGMGVAVVNLDMSLPFTAARARNAGFEALLRDDSDIEFVFFVDGDCEVIGAWLGEAVGFLRSQPMVAAVCGRLKERHPEQSVYNRLCDMEWDVPSGEVKACGGIVMIRRRALEQVGGFREDLIAGEEPELCVRLRQLGWRIWRLSSEMALHDAAMFRFGQWWKRAQRGGHAFAEGAHLHGAPPERHGVEQRKRAVLWGLAMPLGILALAVVQPLAAMLFLVYPLQVGRLWLRYGATRSGGLRALFMVLARFAEASGVLKFHLNNRMNRKTALIEYK